MNFRSRLEKLEEAAGGGECPRCSGTVVIYVGDELESVTKAGRTFTPEEAEAFEIEEEGGRCPVCGASRQEKTIGGLVEHLSE